MTTSLRVLQGVLWAGAVWAAALAGTPELPGQKVQLGLGRIGAVALAPSGNSLWVATTVGIYRFDLPYLRRLPWNYVLDPWFHGEPASLTLSPDEKLMACGTTRGKLLLWRTVASALYPLEPFVLWRERVQAVAFSGDGLELAAGVGREVVVVDLLTGEMRRSPDLGGPVLGLLCPGPAEGPGIYALVENLGVVVLDRRSLERISLVEIEGASAWTSSPDAALWVGTQRCEVYRIHGSAAEVVFVHKRQRPIRSLAVGQGWLALGLEYGLEVWDLARNKVVFEHPDAWIWRPWVGVDGKGRYLLCIPGTYGVESWDAEGWRRIAWAYGFSDAILSVGFLQNGRQLITGCREGSLQVWDVSTREVLRVLPHHGGSVYALATSAEGTWAAWGTGEVGVYNAITGDVNFYSNAWLGWASSVTAVALSADGQLLAANSFGCMVFLWTLPEGRRLAPPAIWDCSYVAELALSPDGTTLAIGDYAGRILVWSVPARKETTTLQGTGKLGAMSFSPDGKLLVAVFENEVIVWDTTTWDIAARLEVKWEPRGLAFVQGQDLLAILGSSELGLWSTETWTEVSRTYLPFIGLGLAASPDGKLLATSHAEGLVILWDVASLLGHR